MYYYICIFCYYHIIPSYKQRSGKHMLSAWFAVRDTLLWLKLCEDQQTWAESGNSKYVMGASDTLTSRSITGGRREKCQPQALTSWLCQNGSTLGSPCCGGSGNSNWGWVECTVVAAPSDLESLRQVRPPLPSPSLPPLPPFIPSPATKLASYASGAEVIFWEEK